MKRRQFNQSLVALAAVTTLPAVARMADAVAAVQPVVSLPRIGLISVGGADGNTVAAIAQGLPCLTRTIAIDTDAFTLMSSGADKTVLIGNGAHRPMHPRQAYEMGRRRVEKMEAAIAGLDTCVGRNSKTKRCWHVLHRDYARSLARCGRQPTCAIPHQSTPTRWCHCVLHQ